ncbi:DEKNAAC104883 [Brettanomyces naardenensis]|uniref:DEKNAAC104883 n=1 Tax=Brettanomyces naardenensis TaxID=13370 RepID=A0A448YS86_BRENA|nr:DEKNAAC104883 [Brettanomyces naardenensis]
MNDEFAQLFLPDMEFNDSLFTSLEKSRRRPSVSAPSESSDRALLPSPEPGSEGFPSAEDTVFPGIRGTRTSHYSSLVPLEASARSRQTVLPPYSIQSSQLAQLQPPQFVQNHDSPTGNLNSGFSSLQGSFTNLQAMMQNPYGSPGIASTWFQDPYGMAITPSQLSAQFQAQFPSPYPATPSVAAQQQISDRKTSLNDASSPFPSSGPLVQALDDQGMSHYPLPLPPQQRTLVNPSGTSLGAPSPVRASFSSFRTPDLASIPGLSPLAAQSSDHESLQKEDSLPVTSNSEKNSRSESPASTSLVKQEPSDDISLEKAPLNLPHNNLLELKQISSPKLEVLDSSKKAISFTASGLVDGRFYFNSEYLRSSARDEFPIACYRRNHITLEMFLDFSALPKVVVTEDGSQCDVEAIRLSVSSSSNFSREPVDLALFINHRKATTANPNSGSSSSEPAATEMVGSTIDLNPFEGKKKVVLSRFQFKRATPNNGKCIIRDYYYLDVNIDLVVDDEPDTLHLATLKSNAISVRGRNPSFYNERKDTLIVKDGEVEVKTEKQEKRSKVIQKQPQLPAKLPKLPKIPSKLPTKLKVSAKLPVKPPSKLPSKPPTKISLRLPAPSAIARLRKTPPKTPHARYRYFPIRSNYYLPPVRVYYLPHSAAHREIKMDDMRMKGRMSLGPTYNYFIRRKDDKVLAEAD